MNKKYTYFVYYTYTKDGFNGDGSMLAIRQKKIDSADDLKDISREIIEENKMKTIVVSNFILLREED